MKTLFLNRNLIVSIFVVMLLTYSIQGISYGQEKAPTVTPGETNTSLVASFRITLDAGVDENAYQIQVRRKTSQGAWISKCVVITHGIRHQTTDDHDVFASAIYISGVLFVSGDWSDNTFNIRAIFTELEPGTTYEARYRDTNLTECVQNPPDPDLWSDIGEGATHLITPPRVDFVDANLAKGIRNTLELDTTGEHIDLLKIPQASLAKLTTLSLKNKEIANLTGLQQATQLTELYLSDNQISDITPLAQLTQLTLLNLWNNLIEDTSLLKQLLRENPKLNISTDMPIVVTEPGGSTDLYFANDASIQRVSFDGTYRQNIVIGLTVPRGITLDVAGGKIYWTNAEWTSQIQRANLDGSTVETILHDEELNYPKDIAVDVVGGKIYWTNVGDRAKDGSIQRANLDGTNVQNVVTGLDHYAIGGIAVDAAGGKVYWTNAGSSGDPDKIQRANLDGTNIEDIIVARLENPAGIVLDVASGKIYWTAGDKIQQANFNGTNVQDIVTGLENPDGIALDVASGKIYWTERKQVDDSLSSWSEDGYTHKIQRANLDGTNVQNIISGLTALRSIALNSSSTLTNQLELTPTPSKSTIVQIHPVSVASPAIGQQLELSLNITGGETVAGYQATVQFDTTALRYTSSANGDYLPAGAFFVEPKVEGNLVKLNAASLAGESNGDGTLATLTFEVIAVKASTLALSNVLLTDSAGKTSVPQLENAEITEPTGLKEDVNGDGQINIADLVLVASNLGKTGQNTADVNGDGTVNIADLVLVAGALGNSAAAPSLNPQLQSILTTADVERWLSQAQRLDLTDTTSQRGILFLQQLLTALTPRETALLPNYPNPFNPETWIPYHLAKDADVALHIYAVNGTLVRTLTLGHQAAGLYQNRSRAAYWDGRNAFGEPVASGVYFYTLTAGDFSATRKMLIRK